MENRLSHAVIPRYHYICTYDAALQATIAPYASWPSATGTPYAAAGTLDGNCTAAVVTGDTAGNTEVESLPVLWRSCSGMRGVWLQQAAQGCSVAFTARLLRHFFGCGSSARPSSRCCFHCARVTAAACAVQKRPGTVTFYESTEAYAWNLSRCLP